MQSMYPSFALGSRAADLKAQLSCVEFFMKIMEAAAADVLQSMLHALGEVWNIRLDRAFVLHCPADALSNLHSCFGTKIPIIRTLLHGVNGSHTSITLQPHSICEEVLTRSFL